MSKYTSQVATVYRSSCKQKSKLLYHCQYNTTDNTKQALLKTNRAPAQTDNELENPHMDSLLQAYLCDELSISMNTHDANKASFADHRTCTVVPCIYESKDWRGTKPRIAFQASNACTAKSS